MTVYFYEGRPISAPFTIESNRLILSSESVALKVFNRVTSAQRWELSFNIVDNSGLDDLFLGMLEDQYTRKTMTMPQLKEPENGTSATVDPTVGVAGVAGETTVIMSSTETGETIAKGSFVKFANHDKIYMVRQTATTAGAFSLEVFPSLKADVGIGVGLSHPGSSTKPVLSYYRDAAETTSLVFQDGVMVDLGGIRIVESL